MSKHPTIPMSAVESSQIHSIGHDAVSNILAVKFKGNGATYHYHGVDSAKFAALKKADSIGSHLGKHIKGSHKFTKVD